jgi:hypothetical protein
MNRFLRLVNAKKGRSIGDPVVIAVARMRNFKVITTKHATGKLDMPGIPDVCGDLGIPCIHVLDFFREQGRICLAKVLLTRS